MTDKKLSIPEMSSNTRVLLGRISRMAVGEMLTYKELAALIGVDPASRKWLGWMRTARAGAQREHGVVTECVIGEGIKRLGPDELPSIGTAAGRRIKRVADRAMKKIIRGVQVTPATGDAAIAVNVHLSMLGAISAFGQTKSAQRIETAVRANGNAELAVQKAFEAFAKD